MTDPPLLQTFLRLVQDQLVATGDAIPGGAHERINDILRRESSGLRVDERFRLKRNVTMAALEGSAPPDALAAIVGIWDATMHCPYLAPMSDEEAWSVAIGLATKDPFSKEAGARAIEQFSREHAVVGAAQRLARRSYAHEITDLGLSLLPKDFQRVCERLDKLTKALGGRLVADQVLSKYRPGGRLFDGSLLYGRQVAQVLVAPREPSIPWNYIFQLAMKHLLARPSSKTVENDWRTLVELARDVCATLNVEPYSSFEGLSLQPTGIQGALTELVLYDEMFGFQQWQPKYAIDLLDAWHVSMIAQGYQIPGLAADQWRALSRSMISAAAENHLQVATAKGHLSTGIPGDQIAKAFAQMSAASPTMNRNYLTPLDATA